jgi:hypothetical protein
VRAAILLRLAELARIERALTATGQAWARCRWIRVERLELLAELEVFREALADCTEPCIVACSEW